MRHDAALQHLVSIRRKRFLFAFAVYKFGLQSVLLSEQGHTRENNRGREAKNTLIFNILRGFS